MKMEAHEEKTIQALKHCMKDECYGCPYRHDPQCVPRVTGEAKVLIERLLSLIPEERRTT
jgi:hypothetical protein